MATSKLSSRGPAEPHVTDRPFRHRYGNDDAGADLEQRLGLIRLGR
jgi:hypothetical protein